MKITKESLFFSVTDRLELGFSEFFWGAVWIDANNDGWQDLFFSTQLAIPNYFLFNDEGTFTLALDEIQLDADVPSFSSAKGDYDSDGYYDLIVQSKAPDRSLLLMNQSDENNYIKVTPHGIISNSMAIGSWIKVYANGNPYVHYTLCGEGYISQNSQHLIFGLDEATTYLDSLTIWYPSGHMDSYYNLPTDSSYHLYEGETYFAHISPDDTLVCQGEQVVLDAGQHFTYLWNTGDTTRFISVDSAATYAVTVTNEYGISASNDLTVDFLPNRIVIESITPNVCSGDSAAAISLENIEGTLAGEVVWNNGLTGSVIDSLLSGDYGYLFTDMNGCAVSGLVSIVDPSELLVFANSTPEDVGQVNGTVNLTIFGGVPPYIIAFEGDTVGTMISDLAAGEYSITVIDAYGCIFTLDIAIDSTLGLGGNSAAHSISVYPNPTSDRVEINSELAISRIAVYSSDGVLVKMEYAPEGNSVNLENLASGLYLIQIELVNSQTGFFRAVKD